MCGDHIRTTLFASATTQQVPGPDGRYCNLGLIDMPYTIAVEPNERDLQASHSYQPLCCRLYRYNTEHSRAYGSGTLSGCSQIVRVAEVTGWPSHLAAVALKFSLFTRFFWS
jgi:hypothetical protein